MASNDKVSKLFSARDKTRAAIEEIDSGKTKYFVIKGDEAAVDITAQHHADQSLIAELLEELAASSERRKAPR